MKNGLVSAVITTYKRSIPTLKRAINSVVNQSYTNIEIIVVNDNPEDEALSKNIFKEIGEYDRKIQYIVMPENRGACAARNEGIKKSKGEFIAFLDDDDEWLNNKIELQVQRMSDGIGIVYCDSYIVFEESNKKILRSSELRTKIYPSGEIVDALLKDNIIGSASFPLIRRSVLEDVGNFDVQMPAAQDFELWIRICRRYSAAYIDEPLVKYYRHKDDQISKHTEKRAKGMDLIYIKNLDYFMANPKADAVFCRQLVIFHIVNNDYWIAYRMNAKAIFKDPFNISENMFSTVRLMYRTLIKKRYGV